MIEGGKMAELTKEEFDRLKDESTRRMRELYGGRTMPPYPDFISIPKGAAQTLSDKEIPSADYNSQSAKGFCPRSPQNNNSELLGLFKNFNISELLKNPDTLLILGIILLLVSDKADEKLILALIFIML